MIETQQLLWVPELNQWKERTIFLLHDPVMPYTPAVDGYWAVGPTTVTEALDILAARSDADGYYSPAVDGYWASVPSSISSALDMLAAKPSPSGGGSTYALFFAMMPGDNSATIAVGAAMQFPQDGATSGSINRMGPSSFNLPSIGTYEVIWQVSISEPGQLQLALNGVGLPHTVVGRATGTSQLFGMSIIVTNVPNSLLSVINPVGNSTALTVTPIAGGASSVSATLSIKLL